jgi:hypothetical protein
LEKQKKQKKKVKLLSIAEIYLRKHLMQREADPFIRSWLSFRCPTNPPPCVEKNVPFLREFNPVHILTSYSRYTLILPSHLHRHLLCRLFITTFLTKVSCSIFISFIVLYAPLLYRGCVIQSTTDCTSLQTDELLVFTVNLNLYNFKASPEIGTVSIDWTQLTREWPDPTYRNLP